MKKTTKFHFEYFKMRCQFWIEVMGLIDWRISIAHVKIKAGHFADCTPDSENRAALIRLGIDWDDECRELSEEKLDSTALHEIIHVATDPLFTLACWRFVERDAMSMEEEALARLITNVVWRFYKEKDDPT